jgi:uncharacterized membrane protein YeaQ/YmgE (transglycosylase-associated protein family)
MSIIIMLILGGLVGWAAAALMGRREGILMSVIIGIVGSFLGGLVSRVFTGGDSAVLALTWSGLFWSFIGAVILVAILNAIQGPRSHNVSRM